MNTDNTTGRVTMLGTGSAMCVNCYNTCFFLHSPSGGMLVDGGGGNGILSQLIKADIPFEDIRHMFVTHCHTDHILGAIWMIRKMASLIRQGLHPGPFTIYCNDIVHDTLYTLADLMVPRNTFADIGRTILLCKVQDGETVDIDDMRITFFDIASPVGKQYGFDALMPNGVRLVCLGDEPCRPSSEPYVRGCDWLMCEAFCLYDERHTFHPYEKSHSTARDAGMIAQRLGVKHLVLYHTEDTRLSSRAQAYRTEAARHYSGDILVPNDLDTFVLT